MKKDDLNRLRSGSKWTTVGAIVGVFSQLIIMVSLAAILLPKDVGLFSVFLFVVGLSVTLLPLGNDFAFVQADNLTNKDIQKVSAAACSIALFGVMATFSIAYTFSETGNAIYVTIVSGIVAGVAESIFMLFSAAIQRNLNYREIERANITRHILTLILSIALLLLLHRVEGAFLGRIISNAITLVMLWKPMQKTLDVGPSTNVLLSPLARNMLAKNVLGHISKNAEVVAASPQLGTNGLGIYDMGRRVVAQPRDFIGSIMFKFTYPMFSKMIKIENATIRDRFMSIAYRNVIKTAAIAGFPLFSIALLLANPLIVVLFGQEWNAAIAIVQIFALTAFVQVLGNNIITSALTAVGGSDKILKAEYIILLPRLLAVFAASFYGPIHVALVMSLFILIKLFWMQWELDKLSTLSFGLVANAARPMFFVTLIGLAISLPIKSILPGILGAAVAASLFCLIYAILVLKLEWRFINSLISSPPPAI